MEKLEGDFTKFGAKSNRDYDFPPSLYVGGKEQGPSKVKMSKNEKRLGKVILASKHPKSKRGTLKT